jgi:hypothetical protein
LPHPNQVVETLRGTPFAAGVVASAEAVLQHDFPLLGQTLRTEPEIRWRRDYGRGLETGLEYFRRIPYLDAARAGDHKIIWELNRHQHLVLLAQAYLLTDRGAFLEDLWYQLETWLDQNPFCRGMNWTSALEVAFRSLSWIWIEHLTGEKMPARLRRRWLPALFQHGLYLENNLSIYFSPNTHLQGEALALHALGALFGGHPKSSEWQRKGSRILRDIIHTHVRKDGTHFEQSSYYHVYALDMFLFHAVLEDVPEDYRAQLRRMAEYLWAVCSTGEIPFLGDDDGGRLFHPYGNLRAFGRSTLATCAAWLGGTPWHGDSNDLSEQAAWWLGAPAFRPTQPSSLPVSRLFPEAGVAVMSQDDISIIADTRGFGSGGAGHSHAHALHFTLRRNTQDVLLDPGTYTYVAEPAQRQLFRSTAFHNTVVIDQRDQADTAGPFRWRNVPQAGRIQLDLNPWHLRASCSYRGLAHTRQMLYTAGGLFVLDSFSGPGEHMLDQMWHSAGPVKEIAPFQFLLPAEVCLVLPKGSDACVEDGWHSPAPGVKTRKPVIRVSAQMRFPGYLAAAFLFSRLPGDLEPLRMDVSRKAVLLSTSGFSIEFSTEGVEGNQSES